MNRNFVRAVLAGVMFSMLSGCYTYDPYTGDRKVSDTTKGAGIGAAVGAVVGLLWAGIIRYQEITGHEWGIGCLSVRMEGGGPRGHRAG